MAMKFVVQDGDARTVIKQGPVLAGLFGRASSHESVLPFVILEYTSEIEPPLPSLTVTVTVRPLITVARQ